MRHLILLLCFAAQPVAAEGFCGASDAARIAGRLGGQWSYAGQLSLYGETTDATRSVGPVTARLDNLTLTTPFLDDLGVAPLPLEVNAGVAYDMDEVDDVLDATDSAGFADALSDTRCGPEALPQLTGIVETGGEMSVDGTVTLIPYFDDRVLAITELTLSGAGAVIFHTETALMTPISRDE